MGVGTLLSVARWRVSGAMPIRCLTSTLPIFSGLNRRDPAMTESQRLVGYVRDELLGTDCWYGELYDQRHDIRQLTSQRLSLYQWTSCADDKLALAIKRPVQVVRVLGLSLSDF